MKQRRPDPSRRPGPSRRPDASRRPGRIAPGPGPARPAAARQAPRRPTPLRPERPESSVVLIHGRNAVLEAARAGRVIRVYQASGLGHDPRLLELATLAEVVVVEPVRLDTMAPGVHQGVAAELKPRRDWALKDLLETDPSLLIALDSIMDPQNLGAILRSAEVAGCEGAVVPDHRSAPLSAVAVKASSGASELLRIARVSGMPSAIAEIKRAGIWCVALDPRGELISWEFDFKQRVCIVVGSEGEGVHRLVRERCDARVKLPVAGHVASFNASVAAAALLYEVMRQRSGG